MTTGYVSNFDTSDASGNIRLENGEVVGFGPDSFPMGMLGVEEGAMIEFDIEQPQEESELPQAESLMARNARVLH